MFNEVGECVGIAFQSLSGSDAENIGYVIPTPVIQHFLTDFRYKLHLGAPVVNCAVHAKHQQALGRLLPLNECWQVCGP